MSKDNVNEAFNALMPFVVASTIMEPLKKLEWQWRLADQINAVFLLAIVPVADGMVRTLIGPELEKRGLNPLKDWHWQAFWQETEAKACFMDLRDQFDRMRREAAEREIIRRFVWEGE